ncbi:MAG: transcriptional regulator [Flavobacteriaceae bacterium]|nr:transcriptional regulator [Flavobacteriaceae bacterium]|tara:strand:- start:25564 stop:26124 length:561 start_codon:yes stop_codon:yes gene_type:complete
MISLQPDKGVLLVAEPSIIGDVSFNRSVVLLAEHNEEGSVGFILNKPLKYNLKDFIPEVNCELPVYNGGPVEQDNLYFIHRIPEHIPDSIEIAEGIYWGGDFNAILELLQKDELKASQIQFFLGYSGWDRAQLDQELEVNSWVITKNKLRHRIIGENLDNFWKEQMIELGGDYLLWSNAPENPSYN